MEKPLLNDPLICPSDDVLENALGKSFESYKILMETISNAKFGLVPEWRYYKDGGAWLCKVQYKKKTVFWLSVWDSYFKTTFYFTEKTSTGIASLDIEDSVLSDFAANKPIGKLLPLTLTIQKNEHLENLFKLADYKRELK
ncbi:MAG: DUF3788 family protein [Bacteroidales bacterium]|nr:DUF3788 family protein [Bacteroidales bacterium]